MRLFYKIKPDSYKASMDQIREKFSLHQEVDEARTILSGEDDSQIERVIGTYDPESDDVAQVRVTIHDKSLRQFFDSILGEPFLVKD
ncbi:MAG: hypothetical protein JW779_13275 [Candidatus Thorarchaeota archaeon]|nr:hypothetical protein [Candidatus Thorarchaeota archaeon]